MTRALPVLLVVALLLSASGLALAQPDDDERGRGRGRGGDDADERGRGGSNGRGPPGATPPAPVGTFDLVHELRAADGDYVSFTYNDTGVANFTANGTRLFSLLVIPEDTEDAEDDEDEDEDEDRPGRRGETRIAAHGSQIRLRTDQFTFTAHDNPTAVSRASTDGLVQLTFAEGAELTRLSDERATFQVDGLSGTLRGDDLRIDGRVLTAEENLLVFLDKPRGAFDVHRRDLSDAIGQGSIGAEATFAQVDGELKEEVVSYGNVTMRTVKAEEGNLTVLIEGHGFDGRVVVLNVDRSIVRAATEDELVIQLDNLSIGRASNLSDILNPDDDGYNPEYYPVFDPNIEAFQLILTLPHYSVHTLSVTTPSILPPPSVVLGIVLGVVVLVPSAFVLFRRPRD